MKDPWAGPLGQQNTPPAKKLLSTQCDIYRLISNTPPAKKLLSTQCDIYRLISNTTREYIYNIKLFYYHSISE